jgi:hypothetical protein
MRSVIAVVMIATGCAWRAPVRTPTGQEPIATAWPATVVAAHREMSEDRHANADRLLREFAAAYRGTAEAAESNYWRAMVALDPANETGSAREAVALLDAYLETRLPLTHRAEATVLRRLAQSLVSATPASGTPAGDPESRDAEMQRLKQELEATKAELERIRKRLAPPPPTTPPPPPVG